MPSAVLNPPSLEEVMELFRYLSDHPTCATTPLDSEYRLPPDAIFGFGRVDPLVAKKAAWLYGLGGTPRVMFTGGTGKDSGTVLAEYGVPEAVFLGALASYYGVPPDALILETQARHGGENCRLGYEAIAMNLRRHPASITVVAHATSLRRLVEVFFTIAEQHYWPPIVIQAFPTDYLFQPANWADRAEAAAEIMRLAEWPIKPGSTGRPMLRPQPDLPEELVDIARRIQAEQAIA